MAILAGFFSFADNGFASFSGQNGAMRMKNNWIYRKQLLLEYGALATTKNEIPLRDFQSGTDEASRAQRRPASRSAILWCRSTTR
jgi:hypothetical protein